MTIHTRICKSLEETQALASQWVQSLGPTSLKLRGATTVGLSGDLGSGKTSFVQGVARALGITDHVTSPTFILERVYPTSLKLRGASKIGSLENCLQIANCSFRHLIHIDAYRLDSASELKHLGFAELASDLTNLILIEWPERVSEGLPFGIPIIKFEFIDETTRKI